MELLTEQETADLLKLKVQTLQTWRHWRKGPPYLKIEGAVRYDRAKVEEWIASKSVEATK